MHLTQGRKNSIKIHEDASGSIYTVGVTMKTVKSAQDVSVHCIGLVHVSKLGTDAFKTCQSCYQNIL